MSRCSLVVAFASGLALASLPLLAQQAEPKRISSAPVPTDPHELVTGGAHTAASPDARAAALALLVRAQQNSKLHNASTPPHRLDVAFNAGGNVKQTGSGELAEIWLSGRQWRWTASLGGASIVRLASGASILQGQAASEVPMRVHMLRNAIFWAALPAPSNDQIRTAEDEWNGKPVTCLLFSRVSGAAAQIQTRLWQESEYCIDPASGLLQVHSIAPGTYTVYGYSGSAFHGLVLPDRITIYVAGEVAVDASLRIADPTPADESLLAPAPEMRENGEVVELAMPVRFPLVAGEVASGVATASNTALIQPVIVHAQINADGTASEEEISAASDPALEQRALDLVKGMKFHYGGVQRQAYINVEFSPARQ
jgi:hypothetical protein